MVIIYKFQLQKLLQQCRNDNGSLIKGLIGGSIIQDKFVLKSIYLEDQAAREAALKLMEKKDENYLGVVLCGKQAIQSSLAEIKAAGPDNKLYVAVNCEDSRNPSVKAYSILANEVLEQEVRVDDIDLAAAKKNGMLMQVDDGYYSIRIKITGGNVTADNFTAMAELSRKYGNGNVHITSRQGVEIPFVHVSDLDSFFAELTQAGMELGATGPRVRAVLACQGDFVCTNGLINAPELAQEIAERFFGRELAYKFKIAITGCPSNCLKADENDLGIKGVAPVTWVEENCSYCGTCAKNCPTKAITVSKGNFARDKNLCVDCGKCARVCRVGGIKADKGYRITVGGTFGRNIAIGKPVYHFVQSKDLLFKFIEYTLEFFREFGQPKERINKTLARVGWDTYVKFLHDKTGIVLQ